MKKSRQFNQPDPAMSGIPSFLTGNGFRFSENRQNALQEYIEQNFHATPCLIRNILTHTAIHAVGLEETIAYLAEMLDGLGITESEIEEVITKNA